MLRLFVAALLLSTGLAARAEAPQGQAILHLLDYVAVEYPGVVREGKVLDEGEYAEQVEFSNNVAELIARLPAHPGQPALAAQAASLASDVRAKADGARVAAAAGALGQALIRAYGFAVAPRAAPDLARGRALYLESCSACHGSQGRGDGPAAAGLEPRPVNFTDPARQDRRSVLALFNTTTLGISGTSMAAFGALPEADRWALAFFTAGLLFDDTHREAGQSAWRAGRGRELFPSLAELTAATPESVRARGGEPAVAMLAWLRAHPEALSPAGSTALDTALAALDESLAAYRTGDARRAHERAVAAYLEGVELAEARLDAADRELRPRIEADMLAFRAAIQRAAPVAEIEARHGTLATLLRDARDRLQGVTASPGAQFASAFIIIAREGLEAVLVLAAMAAFLRRTGRHEGVKWLHGGWIGALALGGVTWWLASRLIAVSGAQREVTEGVVALLAAAVLLYVGFWLHSKSYGQRWSAFIKSQVSGALGRGTLWSLALVSFMAVYREVFETVLFYQALLQQGGGSAVLAGFATGCAVLVAAALLIVRFSARLPLGTFFAASSALLALMAVVFAGQGVAALQEAGRLPATLVSGPTVALLGIHPTLQGLGLQGTLLVLISVLFYLNTRDSNRPAAA
jgi:high-affinity iron transporter